MRNISLQQIRGRLDWDRLAIGLSALCGVHCLVTVLLVGTAATIGSFLEAPIIHEVGLAVAVVLGAVALGVGLLRHSSVVPPLVGFAGLTLMASALVVPHGIWESILTLGGVGILASGHLLNRRAHRRAQCCRG